MIPLLITLILVALLWFVFRTMFGAHPRNVLLVIDVVFVLMVVIVIARWAGVL